MTTWFYNALDVWFHPTTFAYLMASQYIALAIWQGFRHEYAWAGVWLNYGLANIFIASKQ